MADTPEGDSFVEWTVGFGTRWQSVFGSNPGDVNSVSISDIVNVDEYGNEGIEYLSLPKKFDNYEIYEISGDGKSWTLGDVLTQDEDYEIEFGSVNTDGEKEIKINFIGENTYERLALVFKTEIDLDAWQLGENSTTDDYKFYNTATVSYNDFEETVWANNGFNKAELYGSKKGFRKRW
ncbi:hypothetical protein [Secundilactobacillus collinoides]|uniref:hypothetical protein n=1 Tax=Secundilactobacillus collinoides TaxID=33960 RepID=UPI0006D05A79|nr:hypothetical protein [Secundilactobacillus collinoides]